MVYGYNLASSGCIYLEPFHLPPCVCMRIYIDALVSGDVDHSGKRVQNGLAWELPGVYFILLNSPIACLLAVAVYVLADCRASK